MKTRYILLGLVVAFAVVATPVMPPYDNSKPPTLSLPVAYQRAVVALGSATNKLHCVKASITTDFGSPRWSFDFYAATIPPLKKCMTVDFGGNVEEDNGFR
jgi:hypothetical protein